MKGKRSDASYGRKKRYIRPNPFFIIVCEGKITEVDYFKSFPYYHSLGKDTSVGVRYSHKAVHIVPEAGQHVQVIEKADRIFKDLNKELGTVPKEDVWCVFDCDNDVTALREAVELAKRKGFHAIYSIQCFELWFVLHFQNLTSAIDKREYDIKTGKFCDINYTHGTKGMYELLLAHQETAISKSKQLWTSKDETNCLYEDPITNVHELVVALNQAYSNMRNK
ncbi:RloB family protein [Paenibacillus alginolyticus]|uniref:RloB family protein n=1 Tax=Paenibacillus alginolyticus TaxID=59839 RepID=A0ABT4G7X0_9BACL|nr:RloB family protein [Paenibacillus alginolyticus]MCY9692279.1 RloB family protein [Paenibacillus alginolyticus]MEC0145880.1 RloB family protein [Paenibacillus alginolyticus]